MNTKPAILVVEDNADDALLLSLAFKEAEAYETIEVVRDAEAAMHYLQRAGAVGRQPWVPIPQLLVLDLKLPGISGFELLEWVRRQPWLTGLDVVVLSGVEKEEEMEKARALGARFCFTKPWSFRGLVDLARQLSHFPASLKPAAFWATCAKADSKALPPPHPAKHDF